MKLLALFFVLAFQLAGCADQVVKVDTIKGRTMGTSYSIIWPKHTSEVSIPQLQTQIDTLLSALNNAMSTYDKRSELSLFNQSSAPANQAISDDFYDVMILSKALYQQTDGYFDVSVGPLVNLWGFGPDKMPSKTPLDSEIQNRLSLIGLNQVDLDQGILSKSHDRYIDLSAVAKGYAVDKVAEALDEAGIKAYLVEIGGEMRAKGVKAVGKPWRIAIETPDLHQRKVQKILPVSDVAIATSGDYRNYFELDGKRYSHTIDPKTGKPVEHDLASVTVIDSQCARADALATAMLVMGKEKAKAFAIKNQVRAYLIVRNDQGEFEEYLTPAFAGWFNP